jgi:heptosyltransferase-3
MKALSKKYLIICTLRLGDILLSTPIANSIRQNDPSAKIDYLVLQGNEGILEGNPDINQVIALPHRTTFFNRLKEYFFLWNRYDIALSPVSSDRARLYGFISAKKFYGFYNEHTSKLSKALLTAGLLFDDFNTHTVIHNQRLLSFLKIQPSNKVTPPLKRIDLTTYNLKHDYIVIHPYPKFNYKMWSQEKWIDFIQKIIKPNLQIVLTGSIDENEIHYCQQIESQVKCINLAGKLSLGEVAYLISKSKFYVGPDTGVTHIAAATGVLTIALFGPTNPVKWGPWPYHYYGTSPVWDKHPNTIKNNVLIVQNQQYSCVPCGKEGCYKNILSFSDCLKTLPTEYLISKIYEALDN